MKTEVIVSRKIFYMIPRDSSGKGRTLSNKAAAVVPENMWNVRAFAGRFAK